MFQCYEQEEHKKTHPDMPSLCSHCLLFMTDSDKCLEDSVLTPTYRLFYPDGEECYFHDRRPKAFCGLCNKYDNCQKLDPNYCEEYLQVI